MAGWANRYNVYILISKAVVFAFVFVVYDDVHCESESNCGRVLIWECRSNGYFEMFLIIQVSFYWYWWDIDYEIILNFSLYYKIFWTLSNHEDVALIIKIKYNNFFILI